MMEARINVPAKVARNEPFEVRLQIRHAMETGYRTDDTGKAIPRNVVRNVTCRYNGDVVFAAQLSSGIAANPYLRFFVTARSSGELVFEWVDDAGVRVTERAPVIVA
jgi:sulfur-oxidizing protein SoxZ